MAKDFMSITLKDIAKINIEGVICGIVDDSIAIRTPDGAEMFLTYDTIVKVFKGNNVKISIVSSIEKESAEV